MSEPDPESLVRANYKLAIYFARRFARRSPHLADEFESDALFALFRAARKYDPAPGTFGAFAGITIERTLRQTITRTRAKKRGRRPLSLNQSDDDGGCLADTIADPRPPAEDAVDDRDLAEVLLSHMPARSRAILELRAEGYFSAEIAEAAGISQPRLRQLLNRERERLGIA